MNLIKNNAGFTLIELLIVIAIIATLSVVVVLVINPMEYLKQARDSRRLSELKNIDSTLNLASINNLSLGSSNTVYVSIPDASSTCANLGLPSLPSGWSYACSNSTNYQKVDGNGWVPVNFNSISYGSPLAILPVDPVNATSTGNYYTYVTGGSWKLTAVLESEKKAPAMVKDGGPDPGLYEVGSNLNLANFQRGLAGYWKFDEGSGTLNDSSGYGNNGAQSGGVTYGVSGKVGNALSFDGGDDYVDVGTGTSLHIISAITIEAWIYPKTTSIGTIVAKNGPYYLGYGNSQTGASQRVGGGIHTVTWTWIGGNTAIPLNTWSHIAVRYDGLTIKVYLNGNEDGSVPKTGTIVITGDTVKIGYGSSGFDQYFNGLIDDVRIYNRALSAVEISAIYNATK